MFLNAEMCARVGIPCDLTGADGHARGELDDSSSAYNGQAGRLNAVLSHPTLFQAVPELSRYTVKMTSGASTIDDYGVIYIKYSETPAQKHMLLLHEIQHVVQWIAGFSPGHGNQADAGEVEARNVSRRFPMSSAERRITPWDQTQEIPSASQIIQPRYKPSLWVRIMQWIKKVF